MSTKIPGPGDEETVNADPKPKSKLRAIIIIEDVYESPVKVTTALKESPQSNQVAVKSQLYRIIWASLAFFMILLLDQCLTKKAVHELNESITKSKSSASGFEGHRSFNES